MIEEKEYDYSIGPTKREKRMMKAKRRWAKAMARKPGKSQTCLRCPYANSAQCINCKHKEE